MFFPGYIPAHGGQYPANPSAMEVKTQHIYLPIAVSIQHIHVPMKFSIQHICLPIEVRIRHTCLPIEVVSNVLDLGASFAMSS
jgi:hypothetical protein